MVTLANPRQRDDSRPALQSDFRKPTGNRGHDDDTLVCLFTSLTHQLVRKACSSNNGPERWLNF